jgi:hypothetical protein
MNWQTIETCPKDKVVDVWSTRRGRVTQCSCLDGKNVVEDILGKTITDATHWKIDEPPGKEEAPIRVYLAYYHTGFTDDPPVLLDVFSSRDAANDFVESHKRARDRQGEYEDKAEWWVDGHVVRGEKQ